MHLAEIRILRFSDSSPPFLSQLSYRNLPNISACHWWNWDRLQVWIQSSPWSLGRDKKVCAILRKIPASKARRLVLVPDWSCVSWRQFHLIEPYLFISQMKDYSFARSSTTLCSGSLMASCSHSKKYPCHSRPRPSPANFCTHTWRGIFPLPFTSSMDK